MSPEVIKDESEDKIIYNTIDRNSVSLSRNMELPLSVSMSCMTVSTITSIQIACPPSEVRAVCLDFEGMRDWHTSFIRYIEQRNSIVNSDRKPRTGLELKPGDTLRVVLGTGTGHDRVELYPKLLVNDEQEFRWERKFYGVPGLVTSQRIFRFEESKAEENVGGTTFLHVEHSWGGLAPLIEGGKDVRRQAKERLVSFNTDLKSRCEKLE